MALYRFAWDSWTLLGFGQLAMKWPDVPHAGHFRDIDCDGWHGCGRAWRATSAEWVFLLELRRMPGQKARA